MAEVILTPSLIMLGMPETNKEAVLHVLVEKLDAGGYVRDGFADALIQREKEYPTGLPSVIPVALCHTGPQYVIQNALAIGTLAQPVDFNQMGSPEKSIPVEIVFLLALKNAKGNSAYLATLFSMIKRYETLSAIREAQDAQKLASYVNRLF